MGIRDAGEFKINSKEWRGVFFEREAAHDA
jgi:hypothetical protein